MILDQELGGIFDNGKFLSLFTEPEEPDFSKGLNKDTLALVEALQTSAHENLCLNLVCMPDIIEMKNLCELNIFLIYKEAYLSIAFGNYNAGLLVLGQLLEGVLKKIILVKTGKKPNKATFGQAIRFTKDHQLIDAEDIKYLGDFNNEIRNSYAHYKLSEILPRGIRTASWAISIKKDSFNPEEFLLGIYNLKTRIREGKIKPVFIDPLEVPSIAALIKEDIDRKKAVFWLWSINSKLEELFIKYLTVEKYEEFFVKYGRAYENLESIPLSDLLE